MYIILMINTFFFTFNKTQLYFWRYYGLKPKLDEAYIRIKELERENDFLKWSKIIQGKNSEQSTNNHIIKTFSDVITQTQPTLYVDKVC